MSQIDYASMTDQELKEYLLRHRDDLQAFYAYMDRRHARPPQEPIIAADEVDLPIEEHIKLINKRMRSLF